MHTKPLLRSTVVTTQGLPRPCTVSPSQSPKRPRRSTMAGRSWLGRFAGEASAAVIASVALAPAFARATPVFPERPATRLVRPNPPVDRLMTHDPAALASDRANNLGGTAVLAQQRFDSFELRGPVAGVAARPAAPPIGHLDRHRWSVRSIVRS